MACNETYFSLENLYSSVQVKSLLTALVLTIMPIAYCMVWTKPACLRQCRIRSLQVLDSLWSGWQLQCLSSASKDKKTIVNVVELSHEDGAASRLVRSPTSRGAESSPKSTRDVQLLAMLSSKLNRL